MILDREGLPGRNTLAYLEPSQVTNQKGFVALAPDGVEVSFVGLLEAEPLLTGQVRRVRSPDPDKQI
jgi:hypothetical protein